MRKNDIKIFFSQIRLFLVISFLFLLSISSLSGQVLDAFQQRTSNLAPEKYRNKTIYNLRGDFKMIGNTNLSRNSTRNASNNPSISTQQDWINSGEYMFFVDVDGDATTDNSSRSELTLPANCTEIVYAGLYWSGRNSSNSTTSSSKRTIKFKKEGQPYTSLSADDSYLGGANQSEIFTAYKDVTNYVRQHGVGNYFGADIDLVEGDGGSTGYFGGWGLIVIYENPTMKWRDITIFDGYAYVSGNNSYELPLSGFRAAQNGTVNVTMGMMAGEGDRNISGDNFRIRNTSNNWIYLNHLNNQTSNPTNSNNFFNSSILTDGTRFPNYINNTGLDIVKFDIQNTGNSIIANNQTQTTFRYGSDGGGTTNRDTYVIYNIVFAVDAYVPNLEGVNLPDQIVTEDLGTLINPSQIAYRMNNLQPGDEITMKMNVYNYGNENILNSRIDIDIPDAMRLISASRVNTSGMTHSTGSNAFPQPTWVSPVAPNSVTNGAINSAVAYDSGVLRWNLGMIPNQVLPTGSDRVALSTLTYVLKVTDNCIKLRSSNENCTLSPIISGEILGVGANSNSPVNPNFIVGYNTTNACEATPIYGNTEMDIVPSAEFLASCSETFEGEDIVLNYFCEIPTGTVIPRDEIEGMYPDGSKFYSVSPTTLGYESSLITDDFNVQLEAYNQNGVIGQIERYYVLLPETTNPSCYFNIRIFVSSITSVPQTETFSAVCEGVNYTLPVSRSPFGVQNNLVLKYYTSDNDSSILPSEPHPTTEGTYTYYVAETSVNVDGNVICSGPKVPFTITIKPLPTALELNDISICSGTAFTTDIDFVIDTSVSWQFLNGSNWVNVETNSLLGVTINSSNQLMINNAPLSLNGQMLRVVITSNECSVISNEVELIVKGCNMKINPMISNPYKKPVQP